MNKKTVFLPSFCMFLHGLRLLLRWLTSLVAGRGNLVPAAVRSNSWTCQHEENCTFLPLGPACIIYLIVAGWRHRSGSILARAMACCLTAPSHCLNQCWLIISEVLQHSPEGISPEMLKISILDINLKMTNSRLQPYFPGTNEDIK